MGLIARIRRWRYVYGWRLRYWWMDKPSGHAARVLLLVLGFFGSIAAVVAGVIDAMRPPSMQHPQQALNWFIAIVFGIGVAYLWDLTKGKPAKDTDTQQGPTTDDGQSVKHHFGTCWVDDTFLLAWKITGRDKIKAKGGK